MPDSSITADEDTITIRVPGALARAWDITRADDHHSFEPAAFAISQAWSAAPERAAGKGTVRVLTLPRVLAGHFATLVQEIVDIELHAEAKDVSDQDTAAGRAGAKLLQRLADRGITAEWALGYTLPDPAAQAALEDRQRRAQERVAQEQAREEQARQKAEEQREERLAAQQARYDRVTAVLDAAGQTLARHNGLGTVIAPGYALRTRQGVSVYAEVCPPTPEQQQALESAPSAQEWSARSEKIHNEWDEQRAAILDACQTALEVDGWRVQRHGRSGPAMRLSATLSTGKEQ